jgi:parallel beta-helix repeat protein
MTLDNVTYMLTSNVSCPIVVERSNIIVDGKGYTLQGSGNGDGFNLSSVDGVTIRNTNIIGFLSGVFIYLSSYNTLSGNSMRSNWNGILLYGSSNALVGNNVGNNFDGITLFGSSNNNTLVGNNVTGSTRNGIFVGSSSNNNVVAGNSITGSGWYGMVLYSSSNVVVGNNIGNNYDGIWLDGFSNNLARNSITGNNQVGMVLFGSSNVVVGNNIGNNYDGIALYGSSNTVVGNSITGNNRDGIMLDGFSNSVAENNITANNVYGIRIYSSFGYCRFYHNNIQNNTDQVLSCNSTNAWDDGYPSGGNFWGGKYTSLDTNSGPCQNETGSDGIGDSAYSIDTNNVDHYPLMGMFSSFNTTYDQQVSFVTDFSVSYINFALISPSQATLVFNVTGEAETRGFCRVCIPKALINGSLVVRLDGTVISEPQYRMLSASNETCAYIYINYTHSKHMIEITGTTTIPEFPSFIVLPLFMITTLLAFIVYRRKRTR